METRLGRAVLCLCLAWLAGCQTTPAAGTAGEPPGAPPATARPIAADTLYALLSGEMALHRELYHFALASYLQQAEATRDAGVAERATEIAAALNAGATTLQAALLWSELDPANPRAHFLAAIGLLQQGRSTEALDHMLASQRAGGSTRFSAIAAAATDDPALRERLAQQLRPLLKQEPHNLDLLLADALTQFADAHYPQALASVRAVLAQTPDDLRSVALESRILLAMGRTEDALARFITLLETQPDNLRLHMEYARTLARVSPAEAQREFAALTRKHPEHPELLLATALLARENKDTATAADGFRRLLVLGHYRNEAHFYLGLDAAAAGDAAAAITHLAAVTPGTVFLESRRTLLALYLQDGRLADALQRLARDRAALPDEAPYQALRLELDLMEAEALLQQEQARDSLRVLDAAIAHYGEDSRLLYTRSLAYDRLGDGPRAERDLRELLARNPDSATVLNALGYGLANRNERLAEALQLIEHAHRLEPQDAAITASLGWVHYRLGNTRKALDYLRQAWAGMPDAEIGAHLGEVLWVRGEREAARGIWREAGQRQPQHPVLRETVERLTGHALEALGEPSR